MAPILVLVERRMKRMMGRPLTAQMSTAVWRPLLQKNVWMASKEQTHICEALAAHDIVHACNHNVLEQKKIPNWGRAGITIRSHGK